ncbi:pto-interacting protein 1 isoform X2 [Cryptomeria japonica]|uniref:pto-interacting protein 1 isoform X2 n=1 Tax=Cryptomeria japonica TaxID=3369 RepID=UPI0027DA474B|nr:pto-interacting protein 1 isoform X2 [Cryptomeria japonica]
MSNFPWVQDGSTWHQSAPPDDGMQLFNNYFKVTAITLGIIAAVVILCKCYILYKIVNIFMYKFIDRFTYKREPKDEETNAVEKAGVHPGLSCNLQMVPIITTQTNGIGGRGRISEMHEDLSSKQELVPKQIYTNLTVDQIVDIKSYCNESHKVGEGSFARVYRGVFQGKDLAIKEIEHRSPDTIIWVENEVELLQGMEHINIIKLYAWCVEENISYLAYLYIDGCSLDDYLRGNCIGFSYSWVQRFSMIMGIARGIEFLHSNKIIHVDIKPQNIMVDATDNETKLVDFGFSRHVDWEGTHRSTDKIIGTKGYWAPEYCLINKLSYKNDIYSFGIVVLEIITGQRHVDEARGSSQFHIPGYVRHMVENNRFEEAVDARIKQDGWDIFAVEEALTVANIALRCAHPDKTKRPDMNLLLAELTLIMSSNHNNISLEQREEEVALIMSR